MQSYFQIIGASAISKCKKVFVVPEVLEVHVVPSDEVRMVPLEPTTTYDGLEVVVVVLSVLLQEMKVKLKRRRRREMRMRSECFTEFLISGLEERKI